MQTKLYFVHMQQLIAHMGSKTILMMMYSLIWVHSHILTSVIFGYIKCTSVSKWSYPWKMWNYTNLLVPADSRWKGEEVSSLHTFQSYRWLPRKVMKQSSTDTWRKNQKNWDIKMSVLQPCKSTWQNGAGHPPCSLIVAIVTLAADREWTFLCRKQEVRSVIIITAVSEIWK